MIAKQTEEEIHRVASLETELKDRGVKLRPSGPNEQRAPCPLHGGSNPNAFAYYAATDTAKCFSCGESIYSAVDFLMKADGLTYPEALRRLAQRYNIEVIETQQTAEAQAEADRKKSYQELYTIACEWYQQQLFAGDSNGDSVLKYLHSRGLTDDTIRTFQLGFSPTDSHSLGKHLLAQGHSPDTLKDSHLLFPSNDDHLFDKYHQRLIFPLHDHYGRCVGFSGRNLAKNPPPDTSKYVNSRESLLFQKRYTLYGFAIARKAIVQAKHCYLVEGFTDAMMMHQCGIPNVVASQGTAICVEQIAMIRKLCTKITLVLDGDKAGIKATARALENLLEGGLVCEVVTLPDGEDPASYGLKHGATALRTAVASGVDFIQWLWDGVEDKESVEQRVACIKKVAELIGKVKDAVYRGEYVKRAAAVMGVDEKMLTAEHEVQTGASSRYHSKRSSGYTTDSHRSKEKKYRKRRDKPERHPIEPLKLALGKVKIGQPKASSPPPDQ